MSGHSKWATTKHRKGAQDAKRSALFSKLSRNITVAARLGGDPLPENNASLAPPLPKARLSSMLRTRSSPLSTRLLVRVLTPPSTRTSCTRATVPPVSPSTSTA